MSNNSMDNIFEELLKKSASLAAEEMGAEVSKKTVNEFSEEHERKMKKLFAREKRNRRMRRFVVYAVRIAAVLVIVTVVSGAVIFNVDALRIRFLNMFTNTQTTNTKISYKDGTSYSNDFVTIKYVPEGFDLEEEQLKKHMVYMHFANNDQYFVVNVAVSDSTISIDTEDAETKKIEINGSEVLYSKKENTNIFSYSYDKYAVNVMGNIEKDLIIEIIRNIELH